MSALIIDNLATTHLSIDPHFNPSLPLHSLSPSHQWNKNKTRKTMLTRAHSQM